MNRRTAPDAGEDYTSLVKTFPAPPASAGIVFDGGEGQLSEADFAGDLAEAKAKALYAVQEPFKKALLAGETAHAAWRSKPSFYAVPDDQSRSRALHGQAHERQDYRGEGEAPVADTATRHDHKLIIEAAGQT
jgi:hypothetical protein